MFDVRYSPGVALAKWEAFYARPPRGAKRFTRPSPISETPDARRQTLQRIQRTFHTNSRLLHHVSIYLGGADVFMPQQILHRANVRSAFQQVRGERMSQHMRRDAFVQTRPARRLPDGVLKRGVQDMMPPQQTRARIFHLLARGKKPLPFPRLAGLRELSFQTLRQSHSRRTRLLILRVQSAQPFTMY